MTHPALRRWPLALLWLLASAQAAPPGAAAAAEPDIEAIIEALMPSAVRATRNLVVRPRADGPAAQASGPAVAAGASAPPAGLSGPSVGTGPATVAAGTATVAGADPAAPAQPPAGPPPSLALAIQFEANSARVRPESGPVLGSLVAAMQSPALQASRFIIEGHADPRGGADQNLRLSQARADEVRLYLVALGVHPARLRAVGRGASALANPLDPAAAENRRVRVVTVE